MTRPESKAAVRQVLREAAEKTPRFWDLSDAEPWCAMIAMGYELRKQQVQRTGSSRFKGAEISAPCEVNRYLPQWTWTEQ